MSREDKVLVWLGGEVKTPPFSKKARLEAGLLLRQLQRGVSLAMPHSRPMPVIGARCHELRVRDGGHDWRIVYRLDRDAIVIVEVFEKATRTTPRRVVETAASRIRKYDADTGD
jgi:phage-related protein